MQIHMKTLNVVYYMFSLLNMQYKDSTILILHNT
jgi:hypothetical protein